MGKFLMRKYGGIFQLMVKYYEQFSQLIFLSVTSRVYVGFLNYELSLVLTIFHAFLVESVSSSIGE